jgi:hypothetical protein
MVLGGDEKDSYGSTFLKNGEKFIVLTGQERHCKGG